MNEKQFLESLEPELRALDVRLHSAMKGCAPAGLVERIALACEQDRAVRGAMRVEVPVGLEERVFAATADRLQPAVVGRIGRSAWRYAIAASVLLAVGLTFVMLDSQRRAERDNRATVAMLHERVRDLGTHVAAFSPISPEFEAQVHSVGVEIEAVSLNFSQDPMGDVAGDDALDDAEGLRDDIEMLEDEYEAY